MSGKELATIFEKFTYFSYFFVTWTERTSNLNYSNGMGGNGTAIATNKEKDISLFGWLAGGCFYLFSTLKWLHSTNKNKLNAI